ncbi:MAG: NAD-dependent deacylase [Flavobacterium sp.]|nr:NAD-dependent deacylase [Flavobacterium sp.]
MKKNIVVFTGAGMSAESGISTFRDKNGLWENHDIMEVASPEGWQKNPQLVLEFYNQRRRQLKQVSPNKGHELLAKMESQYQLQIITQNVDNLHERAGSSCVLHLHGELTKVRSVANEHTIYEQHDDVQLGDTDGHGNQLRPHIVWFGEEVPALEEAIVLTQQADLLLVIGTSLQVYPAASLLHYAKATIPLVYIDLNPARLEGIPNPTTVIAKTASEGLHDFIEILPQLLEK